MKGIILLNGEPYKGEIDCRSAAVYCCDGAYRWAKGRVKIDKNLGDFDSLEELPSPPPEEIYPSEKNFTDGEIALKKMLVAGADEIEFYGFGGGREDHFLGNLQLLYAAHSAGVKCRAFTNGAVIFPSDGRVELGEFNGSTFSVLPFGGAAHIMDSRGLKYSYPPVLGYGVCRGISNVAESAQAYLVTDGVVLIIVNKGEV